MERRGSYNKSHGLSSKVQSVYSIKEKQIADYLSNDMESDLNYRDEYERLQESRGQMDGKRAVSINIKTKGTVSRPQSSKPIPSKSVNPSRKELYAWHSRVHVPLVPLYNPQSSILPEERI